MLLLLIAALPAAWSAAQRSAVATLTNVAGSVETKVRGAAAWAPVQSTRPLYEGDAVRVGKGGRVLLLQPGCPPRALKEGDALLVSASKRWLTGISSRPLTPAQHTSILRLLQEGASSSRSPSTAVRGDDETEMALSPREENVLTPRPEFRWQERAPGSSYTLELYRNDALAWSTRTAETKAAYPTARPPLKPGTYRWQLYVKTPAGKQETDGAEFTALDTAGTRRIQGEIPATRSLIPTGYGVHLPLISLYMHRKHYTPPDAALQQALTASPDDTTLRALLADVYARMGRVEARAALLATAGDKGQATGPR
jgi:hypothetical protein